MMRRNRYWPRVHMRRPFDLVGRLRDVRVLFTGAAAGPTSGSDPEVYQYLRERHGTSNVVYVQSTATSGAELLNYDVGIISSTLSSSTIRGKWDTVPVPQMLWEEALFSGAAGNHHLSAGSAKPVDDEIRITNDEHPIAIRANLKNGLHTISTSNIEKAACTGPIPAGTTVIGELPSNPAIELLVASEAGGVDSSGGTFPARRTNFFLTDNSFASLNATGLALFDACLDWLEGHI